MGRVPNKLYIHPTHLLLLPIMGGQSTPLFLAFPLATRGCQEGLIRFRLRRWKTEVTAVLVGLLLPQYREDAVDDQHYIAHQHLHLVEYLSLRIKLMKFTFKQLTLSSVDMTQ